MIGISLTCTENAKNTPAKNKFFLCQNKSETNKKKSITISL